MKKYIGLILLTLMMSLSITSKIYAIDMDDLIIEDKEVFIAGPTFGLDDTNFDLSSVENKIPSAKLNFNYEWVTTYSNEEYNIGLSKAGILLATDMYNDTYVSDGKPSYAEKVSVEGFKNDKTRALRLFNLDNYEYIGYKEAAMNGQDLNDVAGVSIGHKYVTIDGTNYTVFFAALDTTQGETEWKSNLDIGADTDDYYEMTGSTRDDHLMWQRKYNHKGFDVAATRAKQIIDTYIALYKKDGYINTIFICGHSRGGAISNILGSLYEDDENIKSYTYTFGTPCTVEVGKLISENKVKSYKTIFNHINEDDFVTLVPNEKWGFRRYGKTLSLKLSEYEELSNIYKIITGSEYLSPIMHEEDPTEDKGLADALGALITDRNQVYAKQKKTLVFDTEEARDDYYEYISNAADLSSTDKFTVYTNKIAGHEDLDDLTVIEEYYYQIFLDAMAGALGNRADLGLTELLYLLNTLSLVAKDVNELYDEADVTFSLPYFLEEKLYYAEMSIIKNIGSIPYPHMTAAYLLMTIFRDARDLNVSYNSSYTYTGEEIKPEVTLLNVDSIFTKDTDYEVSYDNNIEKSNNAKITIRSLMNIPGVENISSFTNVTEGYYLIGHSDKYFTIKEPSSSSKKYTITNNDNDSNKEKDFNDEDKGTITFLSTKVKKGTNVLFTAVPNEGYKVKEIILTDKNGKEIEVINEGDNTYKFTMPSSNINAKVIYEEKTNEEKELDNEIKEINDSLNNNEVKLANTNVKENINTDAKFIKGYDDGSFKPEKEVSNIELMSMVTSLFKDINNNEKELINLNQGNNYWGEEIINKANLLGLIPGNKNDKNYDLNKGVTRGELSVVIYNLIKDYNKVNNDSALIMSDVLGKEYEKEVTKLIELGIIKGYDDGLFHGDYTLTRAEAVTIINRTLKALGLELKLGSLKTSFNDLTKDHWAYYEIMFASNK